MSKILWKQSNLIYWAELEITQKIRAQFSVLSRRKRPKKYFNDDDLETDTDYFNNNNQGKNISIIELRTPHEPWVYGLLFHPYKNPVDPDNLSF